MSPRDGSESPLRSPVKEHTMQQQQQQQQQSASYSLSMRTEKKPQPTPAPLPDKGVHEVAKNLRTDEKSKLDVLQQRVYFVSSKKKNIESPMRFSIHFSLFLGR